MSQDKAQIKAPKKDSIIKNALILFMITLISGLLLGLTYNITIEPRATQEKLRTNNALNAVLSDSFFTEKEVIGKPAFVTKVFEGNSKEDGSGDLTGYAFQLETSEGYGDSIKLMVGFKNDGTISGIDIVKHAETPGLGAQADEDPFKNQFVGKMVDLLTLVKGSSDGQNIDAIGGATITSRAVTNAVNDAIEYYKMNIMEGGN